MRITNMEYGMKNDEGIMDILSLLKDDFYLPNCIANVKLLLRRTLQRSVIQLNIFDAVSLKIEGNQWKLFYQRSNLCSVSFCKPHNAKHFTIIRTCVSINNH